MDNKLFTFNDSNDSKFLFRKKYVAILSPVFLGFVVELLMTLFSKKSLLSALLVTASFVSQAASAATIVGLFNSGVTSAGTATIGNGADPHWQRVGGTAFNGGTNGFFPIGPWFSEDATSRWLTPTANAGDSLDPTTDGIYRYTLNFNLAGFNATTATFAGRFAVDNSVDAIFLNGVAITGSGGTFNQWTSFSSIPGLFSAGNNVIEFVVRNSAQASGNPSGLRVEFLSSNVVAIPEPATWAMMIVGFGLVGGAMRRKAIKVSYAA